MMKTYPIHTPRFGFHRRFLAYVFILVAIAGSAYGGEGVTELLSDACIADITAGTAGNIITTFYETPSSALIDVEPRWWGDMDGFGSGCGSSPGFVVTSIPYIDFQYDTFKYRFKSQAEVDRFLNDLPSLDGPPINVISTDYIKNNPRAKNFLSGDGRSRLRAQEIVITTDRKIDGFFVRAHNGQVITQDVRFDLEFLPPYARTVHRAANKDDGSVFERSYTFRSYNRYEWMPQRKLRGEMIRNDDGTYSFIEPHDRRYNFGAVFLENGATGDDPLLSGCGSAAVPPHTAYLKTTIFNDIRVYSPAFGMTIGLAPQGEPVSSDIVFGDQTHYPDLNRYQELGILDIRGLNISLKGGNDIYMYANEDLPDVCP